MFINNHDYGGGLQSQLVSTGWKKRFLSYLVKNLDKGVIQGNKCEAQAYFSSVDFDDWGICNASEGQVTELLKQRTFYTEEKAAQRDCWLA